MGEQIDGECVQAPDGNAQHDEQEQVFEENIPVTGGCTVDGDVLSVYAAAAFQHIFLRSQRVGRIAAAVILVWLVGSCLAHVAAQFQFPQSIE